MFFFCHIFGPDTCVVPKFANHPHQDALPRWLSDHHHLSLASDKEAMASKLIKQNLEIKPFDLPNSNGLQPSSVLAPFVAMPFAPSSEQPGAPFVASERSVQWPPHSRHPSWSRRSLACCLEGKSPRASRHAGSRARKEANPPKGLASHSWDPSLTRQPSRVKVATNTERNVSKSANVIPFPKSRACHDVEKRKISQICCKRSGLV